MISQGEERWWDQYMDPNHYKSGPVLKGSGLAAWALVGQYKLHDGDKSAVLAGWNGILTAAELDAILAYYAEFPFDIDKNLWENEHDTPYIPELLEMRRELDSIQRQLTTLSRRRRTRRARVAPYSQRKRRRS